MRSKSWPKDGWRWWGWTDPMPGGYFDTAKEAVKMFKEVNSVARWEWEVYEIVATKVEGNL